ncbi:outer membrane immunogenic protein [Rhodopseudomonas julia]|uniref:Outer membrane immunogenic protein n=1 Tax=Rhodopseudomonas julia TaxID=200617 RepID=A0ABU0C9Z7_9BRAD|nr:outer membrane protein [Rhodopseudomonas julia]MDQ0327356.1 outer membrane immunogenic protein [Rhodopseudomonas julia]
MKKILLASAAVALMGGSALAADLPTYEPAPVATPVATPTYNWSGGYVGLQTGWAWSNVDTDFNYGGTTVGGFDFDSDGWTAGVAAGWDYQWNWAVLGVRGDINWLDVDGDGSRDTVVNGMDANWLASLTARAGVGMDRFHPYVLGGVAYVDYDHSNSYTNGVAVYGDSDDDGDFGWTLGAGIEVAVTDNISVSGEYRHYWFDDKSIGYADGSSVDFDTDMDTFMVGVNWRFGGPSGSVMANY